MPWGTDLAIYGAALATANTGWQYYAQRIRTRASRRERASRAIGGVLAFLWHIDPETGFVGGIPADKREQAINDYANIWDPLRRDLEELRVADPSLDEQTKATIDAVTASFTASVWALRHRNDAAERTDWDDLKEKYAAAKTAADALRSSLPK
jgi:hypothetical protein